MGLPKSSLASKPEKKVVAKAPRTSKPAQASLSAEFVNDSDDESDIEDTGEIKSGEPRVNTLTTAVIKPNAVNKARPSLDSSKNGKNSHPNYQDPKSSGKRLNENKQTEDTTTDENSETDSSSHKSTTIPANGKPIPVRSTPDKPQKSSTKAETQKGTRIPAARDPESTTDNDTSAEDSEDEELEGGGSGSGKKSKSQEAERPSPRKRTPSQSDTSAQLQPTFQPPPGFELSSSPSHPSSEISEIFAPENLAGKQVWHIAVPASIPISSIKELSSESIQNGASILSHKGADYGLFPELDNQEADGQALLLPSTKTNTYEPSKSRISTILHLQQLVNIPSRGGETQSASNQMSLRPKTHVKAPRQQPPGLKMRYHPFGTSEASESDSPTVVPTKIPEFRVPHVVGNGVSTTKRKRSSVVSSDYSADSPVVRKKQRANHGSQGDLEETARDVSNHVNGKSRTVRSPSKELRTELRGTVAKRLDSSEKKKRKKESESQDEQNQTRPPQSILPLDVTRDAEMIVPEEVVNNDTSINRVSSDKSSKEEKARRKEEKRKRKGKEKASQENTIQDRPSQRSELVQQQPNGRFMEEAVHLPTPHNSSPHKAAVIPDSQPSMPASIQQTPQKETREQKMKRKEERRKRRTAPDSS